MTVYLESNGVTISNWPYWCIFRQWNHYFIADGDPCCSSQTLCKCTSQANLETKLPPSI